MFLGWGLRYQEVPFGRVADAGHGRVAVECSRQEGCSQSRSVAVAGTPVVAADLGAVVAVGTPHGKPDAGGRVLEGGWAER